VVNNHTVKKFDVVGIGRNCVDYLAVLLTLPAPDSKVPMKEFKMVGGGQATTALVALSRLGLKTAYMGVVGDDPAGRLVLDGLRREGVDLTNVVVDGDLPTPVALIFVDEASGTRTIAYQPTSPDRLKHAAINIEIVLSARCLMIDPHETLFGLELAPLAKARGIPIIYDAEHLAEGFYEMLAAADYIIGSEDVIQTLEAVTPEEALKRLLSFGARAAVITLGAKGSIALTANGLIRCPAYRIEVVDTTAAGDAFHAGFAYGILKGWELKKILTFSNAMGALVCRALGGRESLPSLEEIHEFLG
jgi:sugar/nucleoside kinase (ribokinase family)